MMSIMLPNPTPLLRTLTNSALSPLNTHHLFPPKQFLTFFPKLPLPFPLPKLYCCAPSTSGCPVPDDSFEAELDRLLSLLPEEMRAKARDHPELHDLIEVVLDLGRKPLARFPSGDFDLSDCPITPQDIQFATSQVGDFAIDNRAGISRTLHRISAIRNRKDEIIGLTCRVGRAITGSADLLRDLVKDGASLLVIGPPGVGKTTIIREIARMLADDYKKRVMIVDTSNEIGGDGDIPHAGIGSARRMQVGNSDIQHKVLIEAVENHMPQVIVIDEIGTKLEAMAASTNSQRGIQLVATAHGNTIENLIKNPALDMLIGGIQSVTLGDEEASRRRVQKTILERKGPPTFSCAVELISKSELRVHGSLAVTVDALLGGRCPEFEVRKMNFQGLEGWEKGESIELHTNGGIIQVVAENSNSAVGKDLDSHCDLMPPETVENSILSDGRCLQLFVYGILEVTVMQVIKNMSLEDVVELTDNISKADALLALQSKLKKNPRIQAVAESQEKPVYVTKTCSLVQIAKALCSLVSEYEELLDEYELDDREKTGEETDALEEARIAIEQIVLRKGEPAELLPRPPHLLSLQVSLVQKYHLQSKIVGLKPEAHLCIYPLFMEACEEQENVDVADGATEVKEFLHSDGDANGSSESVNRLPILPDYQ